jgi:hypothetical protein
MIADQRRKILMKAVVGICIDLNQSLKNIASQHTV